MSNERHDQHMKVDGMAQVGVRKPASESSQSMQRRLTSSAVSHDAQTDSGWIDTFTSQ
ncbi:hypothetical protein JI435_304810 [Parastagonospora nodorum SN15]|nr:hypothetical protein JI435_304810 [Parastagonospora nodorum SN15]